jgi:hypothetical protein
VVIADQTPAYVDAVADAIEISLRNNAGTVEGSSEAFRASARAALAVAHPHIRAEVFADMSDQLADRYPDLSVILDRLADQYRRELDA